MLPMKSIQSKNVHNRLISPRIQIGLVLYHFSAVPRILSPIFLSYSPTKGCPAQMFETAS